MKRFPARFAVMPRVAALLGIAGLSAVVMRATAAEPPAAVPTTALAKPARSATPQPPATAPASKADMLPLVRRDHMSQFVTKAELAQYAKKSDVDALRAQLEQMLADLRRLRGNAP